MQAEYILLKNIVHLLTLFPFGSAQGFFKRAVGAQGHSYVIGLQQTGSGGHLFAKTVKDVGGTEFNSSVGGVFLRLDVHHSDLIRQVLL